VSYKCCPQWRSQREYKRDLYLPKLPNFDLTDAENVANVVNLSMWL